ncbi:hypothetical protein QBC41DRAFT_36150 [Cercophora samala]|uniref:Uncharacterized protein n=1 Tax=Cercophora samala TaxID=330535 RepID=A0AA40D5R5_9PEZI|nr:hypothetical protein QBC41DRAFT_36150 [Cercophora samala]
MLLFLLQTGPQKYRPTQNDTDGGRWRLREKRSRMDDGAVFILLSQNIRLAVFFFSRKQKNTHCSTLSLQFSLLLLLLLRFAFFLLNRTFFRFDQHFLFCFSIKVLFLFYSIIPPTIRHPYFYTETQPLDKTGKIHQNSEIPPLFYQKRRRPRTCGSFFLFYVVDGPARRERYERKRNAFFGQDKRDKKKKQGGGANKRDMAKRKKAGKEMTRGGGVVDRW